MIGSDNFAVEHIPFPKDTVFPVHRLWADLASLGIGEDDVGHRLEREGVEKFADSYNGAVDTIEAKAKKLAQA